jgi:putative MATE family efflux protein
MFSAAGTGATVLIARAVGGNDREGIERTALQALVLAIALVSVLTALVVWQARGLMVWLFTAQGKVLDLSFMYLSIVALGMPFMAIMQVAGAIMRGAGNTQTPMGIAFLVNAINVGLTYALIYGHFGLPALGLRGAALATVMAQAAGAVLAFFALTRLHAIISVSAVWRYRPQFAVVERILAIGVPAAFEMIFWQAATIVLMRLIVRFGAHELAAHQLGLTAESLSYMPAVGFGIAATALVGQSLGAKNPHLAERYVGETVRVCALLTVVTAGILFFLPEALMGVLTNEAEVIRLGAIYLRLMALAQLPMQIAGVLNGALRGAGDTKAPMVIGGVGLWLVRLPLAWLLGVSFGLGIEGVWLAMTVDLFLRFGLSTFRYYRGPWRTMFCAGTER